MQLVAKYMYIDRDTTYARIEYNWGLDLFSDMTDWNANTMLPLRPYKYFGKHAYLAREKDLNCKMDKLLPS